MIVAAVPTAISSGLIDVAEDQGDRAVPASALGPAELTRAAEQVLADLLEDAWRSAPRLQLELICAKVLLPGADDSQGVRAAGPDRAPDDPRRSGACPGRFVVFSGRIVRSSVPDLSR